MVETKRRIKLTLAYQGTHYAGWQSQPGEPTIQDAMEEILHKFHGQRVALTASGRTDSGVHARGQVAHFDPPGGNMDPEAYFKAFNSLLPRDIRVRRAEEVSPDFHSRFSARSRHYQYFLKDSSLVYPWEEPYCWRVTNLPALPQAQRHGPGSGGGATTSRPFCAKKDPNRKPKQKALFQRLL
jgi:tRNA pseudouridine38-40 synthase